MQTIILGLAKYGSGPEISSNAEPGIIYRGIFLEEKMSAAGTHRVLGQLEGEKGEERIEVVARQTVAQLPALEVRALRWGSGVGWYTQKTLTLTPGQARRLAHLLRRFFSAAQVRRGHSKVVPLRKPSR
jgi:hypothetical protein